MADFDEMRLVFKVEGGYLWRCPCGLAAKSLVSTAGKARIGARDHVNRRHPRAGPPPERAPEAAAHPSGMRLADAEAVQDLARRYGVRCDILSNRDFQELVRSGIPGRFEKGTHERLQQHYALVDQVVLLWSETRLAPRVWLAVVDALAKRRHVVLFDVPDWSVPGAKAVLVGATLVPDARCMAYITGDRKGAGPASRPCPNAAERITVVSLSGGRLVRAALCKLHHRTQLGYDLSQEGGDTFVEFEGTSRPPGVAAVAGGVRPAPERPMPVIPRRSPPGPTTTPHQVLPPAVEEPPPYSNVFDLIRGPAGAEPGPGPEGDRPTLDGSVDARADAPLPTGETATEGGHGEDRAEAAEGPGTEGSGSFPDAPPVPKRPRAKSPRRKRANTGVQEKP